MRGTQIVGIVLIKNEDLHIERAIRNMIDFCDSIIVTDHHSEDRTYPIVQNLAQEFPEKITVRQIEHPRESHQAVEGLAGTPTWVFVVDGDEIYDPRGLVIMRKQLLGGEFSKDWNIFCNTLNCISVDYENKSAKGYLAPPSRAGARLFNFSMIESWTDCPERIHGGNLVFKPGFDAGLRRYLHQEHDWENSFFRCMHVAFVRRSSLQKQEDGRGRLNPGEIEERRKTMNWMHFPAYIRLWFEHLVGLDWKNQKYKRGPLVQKDISAFLP